MGLCYLARGIIDCYTTDYLKPWDVAAGGILIVEAGGSITLINGEPFDPMHGSVIAGGTPELSSRVLEYVRAADANELSIA